MELLDIFTLNAHAHMFSYVENNVFDNNFVLADEYYNWSQEAFNSDTPWCQIDSNNHIMNNDVIVNITNMNTLLETFRDYVYAFEIDTPYNVSALIWIYGLAMEREMREILYESFETLMKEKQDNLIF